MAIYRTRFFEAEPESGPRPPHVARGWTARYRFKSEINPDFDPPVWDRHRHMATIVKSKRLPRGRIKIVYAPEIVLEAPNRRAAQRAVRLISAAKALLDADLSFGEMHNAAPDEGNDLEDLLPPEYEEIINTAVSTHGLNFATAIAAKATRRRKWVHGITKYWLSLKTCSVGALDHHPRLGRKFTVHGDPFEHAVMAQSIVAGYSAVEELGLEVKANAQRPSKVNGQWNPTVLSDLQSRLAAAGIDLSKPLIWLVRNSPTRIERRHPPPSGTPLSWTRYEVRDRQVQIVDAIHYAGLLRSRISAHRMHDLTRSLTLHDVSNVQLLARRLLLESMGFWGLAGERRTRTVQPRKTRKRSVPPDGPVSGA